MPSLEVSRGGDGDADGDGKAEKIENCSTTVRSRESVAVIGSGMAGLVAAHLLQRDGKGRFNVEVLEMQDRLSLDSASYTLPKSGLSSKGGERGGDESSSASVSSAEYEKGERCQESDDRRVDLPMRAFAAGYYDNLRRMYAYLGVGFGEPRFVHSVSSLADSTEENGKGDNQARAYFIHSSNNHILPPIRPDNVGFARWVIEVLYLLFWYAWFTAACFWVQPLSAIKKREQGQVKQDLSTGTGETLLSYITRIHLPKYYTDRYFLPLMSSITTCTHDQLLGFPASDIIGYARATYRQPHYTITRGVKQAEEKLSAGLKVRFNTRVTEVKTLESGKVRVSWRNTTSSTQDPEKENPNEDETKEFDRVIIATTPDVVGSIFSPLSSKMESIPTTSVSTVVHRDFSRIGSISTSLAQKQRLQKRRIKTFDAASSFSAEFSSEKTMPLTAMYMVTDAAGTRTESIHEHPANVLVTTYAFENGIDEEKILHRVRFTRVLRSSASRDVVNALFSGRSGAEKDSNSEGWKNGDGNVHLVGGWCWDGMVLLEGCIVSAMRVAGELGVDVPW